MMPGTRGRKRSSLPEASPFPLSSSEAAESAVQLTRPGNVFRRESNGSCLQNATNGSKGTAFRPYPPPSTTAALAAEGSHSRLNVHNLLTARMTRQKGQNNRVTNPLTPIVCAPCRESVAGDCLR